MSEDKLGTAEGKKDAITAEKTKGHMLDVAPGCLAIELPAGYIYKGGELHTQAVVREMRGHEEDILAGKGSIVARLNLVIGNCLEGLGEITDRTLLREAATKLTAQDRMAVLLAIRRVSLGDFYDCKITCPECKVAQHVTLNLAEIEIVPMPDRMVRDRENKLPSGKKVKWHVIKTEDEEWLTTQKKKKQDQLTLGLLSRVDSVDDEKLDRAREYGKAVKVLKDLSIRDRAELRRLFDHEEGSIDTKVEYFCEECNHEWEGNMDVGQANFFFPSLGASKT